MVSLELIGKLNWRGNHNMTTISKGVLDDMHRGQSCLPQFLEERAPPRLIIYRPQQIVAPHGTKFLHERPSSLTSQGSLDAFPLPILLSENPE